MASSSSSSSSQDSSEYDYDLVVIGGGSGGMAAAKEAARFTVQQADGSERPVKVALFDYVRPSPQGTTWKLGGTCVNVGCVPKKLMHRAGLIGASFQDARHWGWELPDRINHNWEKLAKSVRNHILSLNFSYRAGLVGAGVKYLPQHAELNGPHQVTYSHKGEEKHISAQNILLAVGGRPHIPDDTQVLNARKYAITSDDVFSLKKSPGKTLVVGGSYIALETAGFLHEFGLDVTVAVRSILLRGFDRQCSERVGELMAASGTKFKYRVVPNRIEKLESGKLKVGFIESGTAQEQKQNAADIDPIVEEEFDTVLFATGRRAEGDRLGLDKLTSTLIDKASGKIFVNKAEKTAVSGLYAVGDVAISDPSDGPPPLRAELTPVAIQAGEYLARRLYGKSDELMDYDTVPTAVFTPFEYGFVGLSEEEAISRFGDDDVETYLAGFSTLEIAAVHRQTKYPDREPDDFPWFCLAKLVCRKSEGERVVGFHFVGPNAGEITQGFALAVRLGAKKKDFDNLVGIHPTDAEAFTTMQFTRRGLQEEEEFVSSGGCGGGKCG